MTETHANQVMLCHSHANNGKPMKIGPRTLISTFQEEKKSFHCTCNCDDDSPELWGPTQGESLPEVEANPVQTELRKDNFMITSFEYLDLANLKQTIPGLFLL